MSMTQTATDHLSRSPRASTDQLPASVPASMCYIAPSTTRAYTDLVDPARSHTPMDVHNIQVHDARAIVSRLSLEKEGFIICPRDNHGGAAFDPELMNANRSRRFDVPPVNRAYWDEVLPLLKTLSGGREVIALHGGLTARRTGKAREPGWDAQVGLAHADVTKASAEAFLEETLNNLNYRVAPFSRMAIYQTWQVISPPPHESTLAFVDSTTVKASDFVFNDCHFGTSGTIWDDFESRIARFSPDHRWYYFSDIRPDEILVFKGYDSANVNGNNYIHGAIDNPVENVLPRSSVESRYAVLWD